MKMCAVLSFYILALCFMGYCVSGAHIEFKEGLKEMGNIEPEMGANLETSEAIGQMENTERELARQHNQNTRVDSGTVIDVDSLNKDLLETLLHQMGPIKPKIALGIANETPYEWKALNAYFIFGTSDDILPPFVQKDQAALYTARKSNSPEGCHGVIAYYMPDIKKTVGIMFIAELSYLGEYNFWGVKIYDGEWNADQQMYEDISHKNLFSGDNAWHGENLGDGLVFFWINDLLSGECHGIAYQ